MGQAAEGQQGALNDASVSGARDGEAAGGSVAGPSDTVPGAEPEGTAPAPEPEGALTTAGSADAVPAAAPQDAVPVPEPEDAVPSTAAEDAVPAADASLEFEGGAPAAEPDDAVPAAELGEAPPAGESEDGALAGAPASNTAQSGDRALSAGPGGSAPAAGLQDAGAETEPEDAAPENPPGSAPAAPHPKDSAPATEPGDAAPTPQPEHATPDTELADAAPTTDRGDTAAAGMSGGGTPTATPEDGAPAERPEDGTPTPGTENTVPTPTPEGGAPGTPGTPGNVTPAEADASALEDRPTALLKPGAGVPSDGRPTAPSATGAAGAPSWPAPGASSSVPLPPFAPTSPQPPAAAPLPSQAHRPAPAAPPVPEPVPAPEPAQAEAPVDGPQAGPLPQPAVHPHAPHAPQSLVPTSASQASSYLALPAPEQVPTVDPRLAVALGRPVRGDSVAQRTGHSLRRSVQRARSEEESRLRTEVQQPVGSGRVVSVTSIRGGVGKTTVTALLSKALNRYRTDPVLTLEADAALGTLAVRLGAQSVRWSCMDVARLLHPAMRLTDLTGYLLPIDDGGWLLPASNGRVGAPLDVATYRVVTFALRRYFAVTAVDCETLPGDVARTAMDTSHARVVVAPMTAEGVDSTRVVLDWLGGLPRSALATTVVALTAHSPDTTLDAGKAVAHLRETGVPVVTIPYDRHLAQGGPIHSTMLARTTRDAALHLAAESVKRAASAR